MCWMQISRFEDMDCSLTRPALSWQVEALSQVFAWRAAFLLSLFFPAPRAQEKGDERCKETIERTKRNEKEPFIVFFILHMSSLENWLRDFPVRDRVQKSHVVKIVGARPPQGQQTTEHPRTAAVHCSHYEPLINERISITKYHKHQLNSNDVFRDHAPPSPN